MKFRHLWAFGLGKMIVFALAVAHGDPTTKLIPKQTTDASSPKALQPQTPEPSSGGEGQKKLGPAPIESNWQERALKWFKTETKKERRKEMRAVSRALRKPCKYCHTRDFKGFTQNRLITQQMMALSAEHGVQCADCHAGRGKFTEFGKKAKPMWKLVHKKKVFCGHCHVKQSKFEGLTDAGKAYKAKAKK